MLPYVFTVETPNGSGTGFFFAYNETRTIVAVATAAHVVERAFDWRLPIKLRHHVSQKEVFLDHGERVVLLDRQRDSASIMFQRARLADLALPDDPPDMIDPTKYKRIGSEVGWVGYPSVAFPHLCFFTGRISGFITSDDAYLIDGVAINGVSGGPVFAEGGSDKLHVIGTVSAYLPNRVRGDALPGLLRSQDITAFQETIKTIRSLDEARRKQAEDKTEAALSEQDATPIGISPQPDMFRGPESEPGTSSGESSEFDAASASVDGVSGVAASPIVPGQPG